MADASVRPETIDVEQIMQQLRARIRERRGADYTETDDQQLATARLEQLLDPRGARPKAAEQFLRRPAPDPEIPNYEFEDSTLFATHRGPLRILRALFRPILKLFINPDPLSRALHLQAKINAEFERRFRQRAEIDPLLAEVVRGLIVETTRAGLEVQSLKLRLESLSTRLDFEDRRARTRETQPAPAHRQAAAEPRPAADAQPGSGPSRTDQSAGTPAAGTGTGERRRRRRRRRRRGSSGAGPPGQATWGSGAPADGAAGADSPGSADFDAADEGEDDTASSDASDAFEASDDGGGADSDQS